MAIPERLSPAVVDEALVALAGWWRDGQVLRCSYRLPKFDDAVLFTTRIAEVAEEIQHHPEWHVGYRRVDIESSTHDADGLTQLDLDLAERISELAVGLRAELVLPPAAAVPASRGTVSEADWDTVEDLLFQALQLRDGGEEGHSGAQAAIEGLLRDQPDAIAAEVRRSLAEVGDWGAAAATPDRELLSVPERLGPYRLGERLGQGGMGAVYTAVDESLDRRVAIKIIRPDLLLFDGARERFRREIEAVARLSHPGIVAVHQVGDDHGVPWFAMELVRGPSLATVLQGLAAGERAPQQLRGCDMCSRDGSSHGNGASSAPSASGAYSGSWERACVHVARQLADALAHAHGRGVLHRDVKPSNVMLGENGEPRLLDFGLSKTGDVSELTRSGALLGSLPYAPPEQANGTTALHGERADVYSLGVLLFELLSLRSPFMAETEAATRRNVELGQSPPLRTLNPAVSWEAAAVASVAMDRDPDRRYQNMFEFAADLQRVLDRRPIVAKPPGLLLRARRTAERHPAAMTGMVVGLLGLAAAALVYTVGLRNERDLAVRAQQEAVGAQEHAQAAQEESEQLRGIDRERSYRAGLLAAQLALQAGQVRECDQALASCPEELRGFEWRHLRACIDDSVGVVAVSNRSVGCLVRTRKGLIAGGSDGCVRHVSVGALVATAFEPQVSSRVLAIASDWSCANVLTGHIDGRVLLWSGDKRTLRSEFGFEEVLGDRVLKEHQRSCFGVALSPDGKTGYALCAGAAILEIDIDKGVATGGFRLPMPRGGLFSIAVSPKGDLLAVGYDHEILLMRPSGEVVRRLRGHQGFLYKVKFSPDGGGFLLSASQDRTARLWRVDSGDCVSTFVGHDGEVRDGAFGGDGSIWTAASDGTVRSWNPASGRERERRLGHVGGVYALTNARYEGREYLLTAGSDGCVRKWDAVAGRGRRRIGKEGRTKHQQLLLHHGGTRCTLVDSASGVRTWSLPEGTPLAPLVTHQSIRSVAARGDSVVYIDLLGTLRRDGDESVFAGSEAPLEDVIWLADGRVVAAEAGGAIVVWQDEQLIGKRSMAHEQGLGVLCAAGSGFLTAGQPGNVLFWDETGRRELLGGATAWIGACVAADNSVVYVCGQKRVVALELPSGKVRWDREMAARMQSVATLDGGQRLLVAGADRVLHVLATDTGEELVGLPADQVLEAVVAAGDVAVTSTVYSAVDLWAQSPPDKP
ncbi:MAG: 4a-hydroxytetrahydrobiopterin dehydratase [Planctomycetota bacterium]